jgi:hypothetical protein
LELGILVAFLGNSESFDAEELGAPVLKMVVEGTPVPPRTERAIGPLDPILARGLAGKFVMRASSRAALAGKLPEPILDSTASMTMKVETDRVFMKPNGQSGFFLFSAKDGTGLFTKGSGISVVPVVDARRASVSGFRLEQANITIDYDRVHPSASS